jgi:5-methylcytosine-specific restriction endonuclease McrA
VTSALRDSGSTRRWRELRAAWSLRLPAPCSRCGELVLATDAWHLDHTIPRSAGGSDRDARPAHARCNMSAGPSFLSEHGDPDSDAEHHEERSLLVR